MAKRQTNKRGSVPRIILLSDARNDALLERALARLPRGSALVFRHYHLSVAERRLRYNALKRAAARRAICVIGAKVPTGWGADGTYGAPPDLKSGRGLRLATAHSLAEIGAAVRARAHAILLSPVYPTRSHSGAKILGPIRFLMLARQSPLPVIALGGMTPRRAARLPVHGWAAIDGLAWGQKLNP